MLLILNLGCERSLEYWHRLLLVRSIVLTKQNDTKPWLKFSSLCQKEGHLGLAFNILDSLLNTNNMQQDAGTNHQLPNNSASPQALNQQLFYNTNRNEELCKYAYLKFLYANGEKSNAIERMREFSANLEGQYQQFLQHQQQQQMNQMGGGGGVGAGGVGPMGPGGAGGAMVGQQVTQPQMPNAFHMVNTREIQKRRVELEMLLSKCYLKLGHWSEELGTFNIRSIEQIINYFKLSRDHNTSSYKSWQAWAYANYEAIQFYRNNPVVAQPIQPTALAPGQPGTVAAGSNGPQSPPQSPPIQQGLGGAALQNASQIEFNQQRITYVKHAIKVK